MRTPSLKYLNKQWGSRATSTGHGELRCISFRPPLATELSLCCFLTRPFTLAPWQSSTCILATQQPALAAQHNNTCTCTCTLDARFMANMLQVYHEVVAHGCPNFVGAKITLLSDLVFGKWKAIIHMDEDAQTVQLLRYGFPAGYKGYCQPLVGYSPISHISHQRCGSLCDQGDE